MDSVLILTFHGLGEPRRAIDSGEEDWWLEVSFFEEILDWAKGRKDVRLTFDDGNCSDLEIALPGLLKRNLQAEFFVTVSRLGQPGFLRQEDLLTLEQAGMQVGLHGMNHRSWRGLSHADLRLEIEEAKHRLEQIVRHPITSAACPMGGYDRNSLSYLKKDGFRKVYTIECGRANIHSWLQPRNTPRRSDCLPDLIQLFIRRDRLRSRLIRDLRTLMRRWS